MAKYNVRRGGRFVKSSAVPPQEVLASKGLGMTLKGGAAPPVTPTGEAIMGKAGPGAMGAAEAGGVKGIGQQLMAGLDLPLSKALSIGLFLAWLARSGAQGYGELSNLRGERAAMERQKEMMTPELLEALAMGPRRQQQESMLEQILMATALQGGGGVGPIAALGEVIT